MFKQSLLLLFLMAPAITFAGQKNKIVFPHTGDGKLVLPVDLHIHTVFSDGEVWPSVRVREADREGLAAIAITDHLEWQPHRADLPNPDRNRSYEIAAETAAVDKSPLVVIRGAEITRGDPPGHINAIFLSDVNALTGRNYPVRSTMTDLVEFFQSDTPENWRSMHQALTTAREQGGLAFFNHPQTLFDASGHINPHNRQLIDEGLIGGIEVANGASFYETAFQYAIDHKLAILGTSDIHDTMDHWEWESDGFFGLYVSEASQIHRTVTLVLSEKADAASIKAALGSGTTAALYGEQLIGPEPVIASILAGALTVTVRPRDRRQETTSLRPTTFLPLTPRSFAAGRNSCTVATIIIWKML